MSDIIKGADALSMLNDEGGNDGGNDKDWAQFKVGSSYTVKVVGTNDFFAFYSYGIYSKGGGGVNSFVAKNPSKKTEKGFPVENLTSWDKAFLYHRELSKEFGDHHSTEAYKYKPELRYAMGFFDLDSGERIVIDVSKKQAQTLRATIVKFEKKISKIAFTVEKATGGAVSLTPVIDMDEDLTDKQRENFGKAPEEFNIEDFHGILYESEEEEMVEALKRVGFDVSLIGLGSTEPDGGESEADPIEGEVSESDLPF